MKLIQTPSAEGEKNCSETYVFETTRKTTRKEKTKLTLKQNTNIYRAHSGRKKKTNRKNVIADNILQK